MAQVPHFRMPLRWEKVNGRVRLAEVEQDTGDELAGCVEAIVRTPYGWRDERLDFGINPLLFRDIIDPESLSRSVNRQEPRAGTFVEEGIDLIDIALRRIQIYVNDSGNHG